MTSDSERYIQLQNVYREQAAQDVAAVTQHLHNILQTLGRVSVIRTLSCTISPFHPTVNAVKTSLVGSSMQMYMAAGKYELCVVHHIYSAAAEFFAARVRSKRDGNIFSLFVHQGVYQKIIVQYDICMLFFTELDVVVTDSHEVYLL